MGTQKMSGERIGEEFKGGKRLPGGNGGRSSRKKLKKADTPGRRGVPTGTETAGERGKKSHTKADGTSRCRNMNMSKGQGQRGEKGQTPATELQLAVVQEGT